MASQIEPIQRMVSELSRLPGIGQKTAQRLAYHIVGLPMEEVHALAAALWQGRKAIRYCERCGNFSASELCGVCAEERRHNGQICVVRDPRDVAAMERMHDYHGLYHVLHGTISPMDGRGPDQLRVKELLHRLEDETVTEVIMATDPTVEGDYTAMYLSRLLKPLNIKVTRLAYGIPVGGDLEYADEVTLSRSLEGRNEL